MEAHRYASLKEFYPFYLSEHRNPVSRKLHFTGTLLIFILLLYSIFTNEWIYAAFIPLAGYGFAWIGHFFFEKNKPATFQYPFYSLASDFIMFWELLTGKIKFEDNA